MKVSGKTTKAIAMAGVMVGAPMAATAATTAPAGAVEHPRVCGQWNLGVQLCLTIANGMTGVQANSIHNFAVPGHFEFSYMDNGQWRHWRNFDVQGGLENGHMETVWTSGTVFHNAPEQLVTFWKDNGGQTGFICNVWN